MAFSANVEQLQPSATIAVSSLAKRLRSEGRDIIDLSAGEPDFSTPAWIAQAAIDGITSGGIRYTPTPGMPELRKAIARTLSDRAGREMPWEGVVVSGGAKQALFNACFTLFGPGDEVLIAAPYWTSYPEMVKLARAEPVAVLGRDDNELKVTPEDLDRLATDATRGLIYSSPSNPTGSVYSVSELQALAEWARDRGIWIIADEIYRQIYFGDGGEAPGLLELPASSLGSFVLIDGASKAYAMTGWRLGFSWTDPEVAGKFAALQSHVTSNASTPSQLAGLAAYGNPDRTREDVARMRGKFRRRRDLVVRLFGERLPRLDHVSPTGAFYLFFRVDSLFDEETPDASAFCSRMLESAGVAMVPGAAFGDDRWVRMSYATSDEILEDAIGRLASSLGYS